MQDKLTHFNTQGDAVMVDVSDKQETKRIATVVGTIFMNDTAFAAIQNGTAKKGDVLAVARIAGIMASKRTSELIPLCHPIQTEKAEIQFSIDSATNSVTVECTVQTTGKTGVEMEALVGANTALMTIYDMCKAVDRGMVISNVHLLEKQGGKSGHYRYKKEGDNQ